MIINYDYNIKIAVFDVENILNLSRFSSLNSLEEKSVVNQLKNPSLLDAIELRIKLV